MERGLVSQDQLPVTQFLKGAIKEGAHLKRPYGLLEDYWIKERNYLGAFYISPLIIWVKFIIWAMLLWEEQSGGA